MVVGFSLGGMHVMQSLPVELCTGELAQAPCSVVITGHRRRGRKAEPRAACVEPRIRGTNLTCTKRQLASAARHWHGKNVFGSSLGWLRCRSASLPVFPGR